MRDPPPDVVRSTWGVVALDVTFPHVRTLTGPERARIAEALDKMLSELVGEIPTIDLVPVASDRRRSP